MCRNFNTPLYPSVNWENLATPPVYLGTKGGPLYSCRRPNSNRRYKAIGKIRWWDAHLIDNFDATERAYIDHAQSCNMFPIFFASSFIRLILSACKRYNPMVVIWGIRGYQNGLITYKSSSFSNLSPLEKLC